MRWKRLLVGLSLFGGFIGCGGATDEYVSTVREALTDSVVASADTTVRQFLPFASFGASPTLEVHGALAGSWERALVRFSGADIGAKLVGRELVTATLELQIANQAAVFGTASVGAHRVLFSWNEAGATWRCANDLASSSLLNNCKPLDQWSMQQPFDPGLPAFAATPTAVHQLSWSNRNPLHFNVTPDVQALIADSTSHDVSWLLRNTAELNGVWVDLYSRESAKPPRLILETRVKPVSELITDIESDSNNLVRARYKQADPDLDPATSVPTAALEERVVRNSYALIDSLPKDVDLSWNSDLRETIRRLGRALNGLMVARLPFDIGHRPDGRCRNLILARDLDAPGDKGSFISDYFDWIELATLEGSRAALDALTGVNEGLHCLTTADISYVERAYVIAFYEIVARLRATNRHVLVQTFWERSLPLSYLWLDATKRFQFPYSLWVIRLPIDRAANLPVFRFDGFANADVFVANGAIRNLFPWAETYPAATFCLPDRSDREPRISTIQRFGLWTEDVFHNGSLVRIKMSSRGACQSLQDLADPVRFGAGDCSLYEMSLTDFKCTSENTCHPQFLPDGSVRLRPGARLTQFGTDRQLVVDANCSGESIPPIAGPNIVCNMPSRGAGYFSPDPEIDRLLRCTIGLNHQTIGYLAISQNTNVCRDGWARDGDDSVGTLPTTPGDVTDDPAVKKAREEAAQKLIDNNKAMATEAVDAAGPDGLAAGKTRAQAINDVRADIINTAHGIRDGDIPVVVGDPGDGHGGQGRAGVITISPAVMAANGVDSVADVIAHEGVHLAIQDSINATSGTFNQRGIDRINNDETQHRITHKGGIIILCGDDGPCGNDKCSLDNSLFERTEECIKEISGGQPACPRGAVDIPCTRLLPAPDGCFVVGTGGPPPVCRTVLCGPEYSVGVSTPISLPETSITLAGDCCGGAGGPQPGGGGVCSSGPWKCECCPNCGPCPAGPFADPVVPVLPCIGCTNSAFPDNGPD
jgi:hypothetical protein